MKSKFKVLVLFVILPLCYSAQPALLWAKSFGGPGYEYGDDVELDAADNIYMCGMFSNGCDFDPGAGSYTLGVGGYSSGFLAKYDPSGNFLWAVPLTGATGNNCAYDCVVSDSGFVYVTGFFNGSGDFDPGPGTTTLTALGNDDSYVCKFDTSGNLIWAKLIGGSNYEYALTIALDNNDNCFVGGSFNSSVDFDPGAGIFTMNGFGNDAFVLELNAGGNFVNAIQITGSFDQRCYGVTTDDTGNVYMAGMYQDVTDFDPGPGILTDTALGTHDVFIMKLSPALDLIWVRCFGGTGDDYAHALTLDHDNNILCIGDFEYTMDIDPGSAVDIKTSNGSWDIFAVKFDNSGNEIWAATFGSSTNDYSDAIGTDQANRIYTTGTYQNTVDFDPGAGTYILSSAGSYDAFLCTFSTSGIFECAGTMGGGGLDHCNGVYVRGDGKIYLTGPESGGDFDPGTGTTNLGSSGLTDAYLLLFSGCYTTVSEESPVNSTLNIYPNPAHDQITVQVESKIGSNEIVVQIINAMGQVCSTSKSDNNSIPIDISDLPAGLYMIRTNYQCENRTEEFTSILVIE